MIVEWKVSAYVRGHIYHVVNAVRSWLGAAAASQVDWTEVSASSQYTTMVSASSQYDTEVSASSQYVTVVRSARKGH